MTIKLLESDTGSSMHSHWTQYTKVIQEIVLEQMILYNDSMWNWFIYLGSQPGYSVNFIDFVALLRYIYKTESHNEGSDRKVLVL